MADGGGLRCVQDEARREREVSWPSGARVQAPPRTFATCSRFGCFLFLTATIMQHPPSLAGRVHSIHPEGDEAIRQTDSDAALARFSAVQKGYFSDPFIRSLVPRGAHLQPPRPPLINVGTYVRSEAIDRLVNEWLELAGQDGRQCQIVSMGAGSDTRFWRIAVRLSSPQDMQGSFMYVPCR